MIASLFSELKASANYFNLLNVFFRRKNIGIKPIGMKFIYLFASREETNLFPFD
jgi:hypothetical protein